MGAPFLVSAISRLDGSGQDGIHLLWTAPAAIGYSLDGYDIQRRDAQRGEKVSCHALTAGELDVLHRELRVTIPSAVIGVQQTRCPAFPSQPPDEPLAEPLDQSLADRAVIDDCRPDDGQPSRFVRPGSDLRVASSTTPLQRLAAGGISTQPRCLFYEIRFFEPHDIVRISIGVPAVIAIALRDDKAVATAMASVATGTQDVAFAGRTIDRVRLYVGRAASSLTVCVDQRLSPEQEEREWQGVPTIAKGINLPVRNVNPAIISEAEEVALASSRLLAGEAFDAATFREVAAVMNATATNAPQFSPMRGTIVTRERLEDPPVELRAWPYAFSLLVDTAWRRMLGFGFFDKDLTPGTAYDYRVTGRFRRRDLDETLFGFHTIPTGTTLPRRFHLGPLLLDTSRPTTVELFPPATEASLESAGLKGITLKATGLLGSRVSISWPTPTRRVVLEFFPSPLHDLTYSARTTEFILGLSGSTFSGTVPALERVVLDFAEPVDSIFLRGSAILCGIRRPTGASSGEPEDILARSVVMRGVRFEPTPAPPAPPFLGTRNLQQPFLTGNAVTAPDPPRDVGYHLTWLPPPSAAAPLVPWPADLGAFPPFDVASFELERRRVDTSGAFEPVEKETAFFGSRGSRREAPPLQAGIDLLDAFPESATPEPPVPVFMDAEDVLLSPARTGPPPGSLHQYRIRSVDAIGRRSPVPTVGSVVRLEKRTPPPQPVGPTTPVPTGAIRPSGVRGRVLQASDPDLTPDDRTLLGVSTNAVALEWGWTQAERDRDPSATEFRVYWQPVPPDLVRGTLVGVAVPVGIQFDLSAELNQPIAVDALAGRYLIAGGHPFKVASHGAGQTIAIRFERSAIDPARVPAAGTFEAPIVLSGAALRPGTWPERTTVVPITTDENYLFVFRDRLVVDVEHAEVRAWVGVSTADDQSYVADEKPPAELNGGRPGNESSLVAVAASARYLERPTFTVPLPLPDVPEQATDEPMAGSIAVTIDLAALLAGVSIPPGHRVLLERVGADALITRMSAQPDDSIGARLPDGTLSSYHLGNPGDHAALLAQIRSAEPRRVEGRFIMDFLLRHLAAFEPLWQGALAAPVAFGPAVDTLPDKAERYVHRVRLVDGAGHVSVGGAIVPQFVRVVSMRAPSAPEFELPGSPSDTLTVAARVHDAIDLRWLLLFSLVTDATTPADSRTIEKPQLLRLPNRRDLYPDDGIRLRLADGSLLAPTPLEVSSAPLEVPDRVISAPLTVGFGKRVSVWAVSMTRDGITSRLSGPRTAFTVPAPLVVPALGVSTTTGPDIASWTPIAQGALTSVERSTDGGLTWTRVSAWLPDSVTSIEAPRQQGPRLYRLTLQASHERVATGPAVAPA